MTNKTKCAAPGEVALALRNLLDSGVQDTAAGFARRLNTSHQAVRWGLAHTPGVGVVAEVPVVVAKVYGRLTAAQQAEAVVAHATGRGGTWSGSARRHVA